MPQCPTVNSSHVQVQGTNDNSIVSKLSMANLGYIDDEYLKHFVAKEQRRSPLINRSYYLRAKAIRHVVSQWLSGLDEMGHRRKQIVSLGAGFDTTYFWVKNQLSAVNHADLTYVEIDYPDVIERKLKLAENGNLFQEISSFHENVFCSADGGYAAVGYDLRKVGHPLTQVLESCGIDTDVPTLFISEVVLTYLTSSQSTRVLKWISHVFSHGFMCVFEQMCPYDEFGLVMCRHFEKLGSPLQSIRAHPTLASHLARHRRCGFTTRAGLDLATFCSSHVSRDERRWVERREMFDEWEGWQRMLLHYFVLLTSNSTTTGELCDRVLASRDHRAGVEKMNTCDFTTVSWLRNSQHQVHVFGHTSAQLSTDLESTTFAVIGGFGKSPNVDNTGEFGKSPNKKSHSRLSVVATVRLPRDPSIAPVCRVVATDFHHPLHCTVVTPRPLTSDLHQLYVFGGRASPNTATNSLRLVEIAPDMQRCVTIDAGDPPAARWRHSATLTTSHEMAVVGGRDALRVFDDLWMFDFATATWREVPLSNTECAGNFPRLHSHSAAWWRERACLVVSGGLSEDSMFAGTGECRLWQVNPASGDFRRLQPTPSLPGRFSHTSHVVDNLLLLVGGVINHPDVVSDVTVVDLTSSLVTHRFPFPASVGEIPLHVHGHTSHVQMCDGETSHVQMCDGETADGEKSAVKVTVVGGGSNCFSFGTGFNPSPVTFTFNL